MPHGVVKWFNAKKGFGFIFGSDGKRDVFVHYSNILGDGFRALRDGDPVEFEVVESDKGPQAQAVRLAATDTPSA